MHLMTWRPIFPCPYHVTRRHSTQDTRDPNAFDDGAGTIAWTVTRTIYGILYYP
jgi:hypothetical protein